MSRTVTAILVIVAVTAIWVGVAIFFDSQINPSSRTESITTTQTQTTTSPTTTPTTEPSLTHEQAYTTAIADHAYRVSDTITQLSELMINPQMGNDTWASQVKAELATIQSLYDEVTQMSTPVSMVDIHYKYVLAISLYEYATHSIAQGIDELDVSLINQAITEINTGTQMLNEAIVSLNEFIENH